MAATPPSAVAALREVISLYSRGQGGYATAVAIATAALNAHAVGERFEVTLDDLVAFAQEGWQYPLADDDETREQISEWMRERLA